MIVTLSTVIQVTYATVDEDNCVEKKFPYSIEIGKLNPETWAEAYKTLCNLNAEAKTSLEKAAADTAK